jgi:endo-1,4-beta-D-glucanase Y
MIPKFLLLFSFLGALTVAAHAQQPVEIIRAQEWAAYKERFVADNGRVIDDANGGISHSEGQGYGLLLALMANDRADFARIWAFTHTRLLLRDDGLAVWKWDPAAEPRVSDPNNASDGDLLIAYALARAGAAWKESGYTEAARRIATALSTKTVFKHGGRVLFRPGVTGFGAQDQPDGPIVNLSYWVFEAFPVLAQLMPAADWDALARSGLELVGETGFGERRLPADWISLAGDPKPAQGFPAEFSYNALRIPLYLMRAQYGDMAQLRRLRNGMVGANGGLALVDLRSGQVKEELMDAGYRIIPALAECVLDGTRLPAGLTRFEPTLYYPSTLHLLALAHAREARPECL